MLSGRIAQAARQFTTSAVRRSGHHDDGGVPGSNLPFKLGSPARMTTMFILFFSIPFAAPFLVVRHHLLKA